MYYTIEELKEAVKRQVDIEDVAYYLNLDGGSGNGSYHCPIHEDKSASLVAKKGNYSYKCFAGCGTGSMWDLVHKVENVSYYEAVIIIATQIAKIPESDIAIKKSPMETLEDTFIPPNKEIKEYFLKRGIKEETWNRYKIHSSNKASKFIVFPQKLDGKTVAYKSISTFKDKDGKKKIVAKGDNTLCKLYPDNQLSGCKILWFTAGEFDCMILDQYLKESEIYDQKVVSSTTGENAFPQDISKIINKYQDIEEIRIIYDHDKAGKSGRENLAKKLLQTNKNIYIYLFPDDKPNKYDVNDFFLEGYTLDDINKLYRYKFEIKREQTLESCSELEYWKSVINYLVEYNFVIDDMNQITPDMVPDWRLAEIFKEVLNSYESFDYCNFDLLRRRIHEEDILSMLDEIITATPIVTIKELEDIIEQLKSFTFRRLIDRKGNMLKILSNRPLSLIELYNEAEKIDSDMMNEVPALDNHSMTMEDMINMYVDDIKQDKKKKFLSTPFPVLTGYLGGGGGYRLGEVHLIGADASVGKTTMLIQTANHIASQGVRVKFYSLETKLLQIAEQEIARRLQVHTKTITNPTKQEVEDLLLKMDDIKNDYDKNLFYSLCFDMTVSEIINDIEYEARKNGLLCWMLDHFHAIEMEHPYRDLRQFLVNVSRRFIKVAGKTGTAGIIACQLRTGERDKFGEMKHRNIDDFAETASLKRDCYSAQIINIKNKLDNVIELSIVKNRGGIAEIDIPIAFRRNMSTFEELGMNN